MQEKVREGALLTYMRESEREGEKIGFEEKGEIVRGEKCKGELH